MTVERWLAAHAEARAQPVLPIHELEILAQEAYLVQIGAASDPEPRLTLGQLRLQAETLNLSPESCAQLAEWVTSRRERGVPIQHLTGFQEFLGHRYRVSPTTLIPRAETEVLVTEILRAPAPRLIAEVGTGTGVIALELLRAFPVARAVASDLSAPVLELARTNAAVHLGADSRRIELVQADGEYDVWGAFVGRGAFDCVVSNPPYLIAGDRETTAEVAEYEPASALYAPEGDALFFYRAILQMPHELRAENVSVWLEIPHERSTEVFELAQELGWQAELKMDLTGRPRILRALASSVTPTGR